MKFVCLLLCLISAANAAPYFLWNKSVAATNLIPNSGEMPALAIDVEGKINLAYIATRAPGDSIQLVIAKETGQNTPYEIKKITPFECGNFVALTFNGNSAMTAANKPTSGVSFFTQKSAPVHFKIKNSVLNKVDDRLFSSFLERPSWHGEIGIEAGTINGTHNLQPKLVEKLRELRAPILRFPGGTDIDYIDWTDMIDNVPGRTNSAGEALPRPVTVRKFDKEFEAKRRHSRGCMLF